LGTFLRGMPYVVKALTIDIVRRGDRPIRDKVYDTDSAL